MAFYRRYGYRRRYSPRRMRQRTGVLGQGGMRAEFSGNQQLIRHTVRGVINSAPDTVYGLADGHATAMPLLLYTGKSNNGTNADESTTPTYAEGSRVNYIQVQLQITQSDATKPNNCYIGTISTSFSDAMLDVTNMDTNFAKLIGLDSAGTSSAIDSATGKFNNTGYVASQSPRELNLGTYLKSPQKRHWIRGLARNQYTLYSGRPLIINQIVPVPPQNRRGQFGSGFWMVFMNESGVIQGEDAGDGTGIQIHANTFFKEIPLNPAEVTA